MAAAATAVRLHGMIHLPSVAPEGPFWRGTRDACRSVYALSSLGVS